MYPTKTLYTAEQSIKEKKINIYKKWEINNQNEVVSPAEQQEDSKYVNNVIDWNRQFSKGNLRWPEGEIRVYFTNISKLQIQVTIRLQLLIERLLGSTWVSEDV